MRPSANSAKCMCILHTLQEPQILQNSSKLCISYTRILQEVFTSIANFHLFVRIFQEL